MGLAGLGAVAGGLAQGLERGLAINERQEERGYRRKQRERQDKINLDADADAAMLRAANEAGAEVMRRYQQDWQKQQPGPTLDGGAVQANPFQPTPKMMLEAGSARTAKLMQLGAPPQRWMEAFAQDEAMRNNVRSQAAQRLRQSLAMGGDITEPLSELYGTVQGAGRVVKAGKAAGPNGQPAIAIQIEGQPQPMVVPADQFLGELDKMLANPADLAKHNLQVSLEAFKQQGTREEIGLRGEEARKTEGVKFSYGLADTEQKHRLKLGEIGAQGAEARKTKATPEAPKPEDANKRDQVYDQLHDEIIRQVGEPSQGMLGGNRIANEMTGAAAGYARALIRANPGMPMEKAVRDAIAEMKKRAPKQ